MSVKNKTDGKDELDISIGLQLRRLRVLNGGSRQSLAQALGISVAQLTKYEIGVNRVPATRVYGAAKLFKVPLDYFFPEFETGPNSANSEITLHIIKCITEIKDENIRKAYRDLGIALSKY